MEKEEQHLQAALRGDGWGALTAFCVDAQVRFLELWLDVLRGQLVRGAWTPSLGDLARLSWGLLIDSIEYNRIMRTRFLHLQIALIESRLAEIRSHGQAPRPDKGTPEGGRPR